MTLSLLLGCSVATPPEAQEAEAVEETDAAAAIPGDWLARAQRGIAEREYRASRNRQGLQAPNRAQNLRTYFEPTGIRVHDRTAAGSPRLLALSLAGVGRGEALAEPEQGIVSSEGARVEIRRGALLEWYENSEAGLEQGFTLAERPPGAGPLVLELALEGATVSRRGDALVFATAAGRKLRYGELRAGDAAGAELAARLDVTASGRVRLEVEDAGATYPVGVDPLLAGTWDAQLEPDQDYATLGYSVSGAGDVNSDGYADVIVGAPRYDADQSAEGAAFVFLGNGNRDGYPVLAQQLRGDAGGRSVPPWGGSFDEDAFQVALTANHPEGQGRVELEVEACPPDVAFGRPSCVSQTSPSWIDVTAPAPGVRLVETLSGLAPGTLYRWRARVLHAPFTETPPLSPPHGPWRRVNGQATEADVRVLPEPGIVVSLLAGMLALGLLRRARRAAPR